MPQPTTAQHAAASASARTVEDIGQRYLRHNGPVLDAVIGIDFAGCRVEELIGRGGMGVVYRGTDMRLRRQVAIKLIATEHAADQSVRRRFEREARLMAAIDHPNVIPVYAAGEQDGHLYLVMRYVDGTDLHRLLGARGRLPANEAARIASELAAALDAAHGAGLVHRDIKPANVLLASDRVYLTDFGITRAVDSATRFTDSDEWVGTVDYMSPEHLRGGATDARSDVYSLGCLLHTILTGTPPFRRGTAASTILAHIEDPPPKASSTEGVPRRFDAVLARALAKRPEDRYPSAGELGAAALAATARRASRRKEPRAVEPAPPKRAEGAGTRVMPGPPADVVPTRVRTSVGVAGEEPTARLRFFADRHRARVIIASAAVLIATAVAALAFALLTRDHKPSPGPMSSSQVLAPARGFAAAYGSRNARALGQLLSADVTRISTTAVEHGRAAVVAEYQRQFGSTPIHAYELAGIVATTTGDVGRVAARYTVVLGRGHGTVTGTVVFGVRRDASGRPVIGLIATHESG
jgi:serine/threonine-protein kinase